VVSSGNDSVNTGSGNDSVQIKTGFTGDAKIDGGSGSNTLSISDSADVKFDSKGNLIITSGDSTVTAKNFTAVVLGNNGDNVDTSASKKALNITSGTGDDSISTGSGKDSITISGGSDSVSTGAGVDIVKLAAAFTGNLTVDGGAGSDKLDLSNVSISSVKVVGGVVIITTADGGTIESSNIENFVYDSNGPDVKGGIKTVGVKSFDKAFVDDAN
jgi:Ca2+-binding RTX toxin-like protein